MKDIFILSVVPEDADRAAKKLKDGGKEGRPTR
jgi:hypothetical protein